VARAIQAFKYEDHPERALGLTELLIEGSGAFLRRAPKDVGAIPLHRSRFLERKYDQAQLLARTLALRTDRTFHPDLLTRLRNTPRQVGLSDSDREGNVKDAFLASADACGRSFLIMDDVFTTGATARAACDALIQGGANGVFVLTLARAWSGG
jgi:ComF family protein